MFVNHGSEDSCEDFKTLLIERGYCADAPYSGTEYDLATGKMTVYAEAKTVDRVKLFRSSSRSDMFYQNLVAEAENLLKLAKARRGMANKDNAKMTSQIREIIEKWKD